MGVDVDAYMELVFENNFKSKISSSFTQNLGKETKIYGSMGEIVINDTWTAQNSKIIIKKIDRADVILKIESNQNIYSYEIKALSQCILDKKVNVDFPGLTIVDTINNMKIIDRWKS